MDIDADLNTFTHEQLLNEVKRLRAAIRNHRDATEHELCWHHPDMWDLLPEKRDPQITVPAWPQFMRGCIRYRQSLDAQLASAPRMNREFDERGSDR